MDLALLVNDERTVPDLSKAEDCFKSLFLSSILEEDPKSDIQPNDSAGDSSTKKEGKKGEVFMDTLTLDEEKSDDEDMLEKEPTVDPALGLGNLTLGDLRSEGATERAIVQLYQSHMALLKEHTRLKAKLQRKIIHDRERREQEREDFSLLLRAAAGNRFAVNAVQLRQLQEDARFAFRFAVISYKSLYKFSLPLKRSNVDQWWHEFCGYIVANEPGPKPASIWSICRDLFLQPFKRLKTLADSVAADPGTKLREEASALQAAKQNLDVLREVMRETPQIMPDFDQSKIAKIEENVAKAEKKLVKMQAFRNYMVQLWVSIDVAIGLLENANLFSYLEDMTTSNAKLLRDWGNQMAYLSLDRHALRSSIDNGVLNLTSEQCEELKGLFDTVHPGFEPKDYHLAHLYPNLIDEDVGLA